MIEVKLPRLSDSMEEGTLLAWLRQVGDLLQPGDDLAEIETDKANMVFSSDAAGTLGAVLVEAGETVAVGEAIAVLFEDGEELPTPSGEVAAVPSLANLAAPSRPEEEPLTARGPVASPVARRIAEANAIDLTEVIGSGPAGRIVKADIEAVVAGRTGSDRPAGPAKPETAKGEVAVEELSSVQATIARRMSESKASAPHFYLEAEIDMTAAIAARARLKESASGAVVPSLNDIVIKACALALRAHPRANGTFCRDRIEVPPRINVGTAVAVPGSLLAPTVYDADCLGLSEIAARTRALARKAREGTISPAELAGGTFTVSNLGMYGVRRFAAIVNPPQAAILAVGEVVEGRMIATLSCDHRILFGAEAAGFLATIRGHLEEPLALAL